MIQRLGLYTQMTVSREGGRGRDREACIIWGFLGTANE